MTSLSNDIKASVKKMPTVVALQWPGNLGLMLIAALWLQIPDSHAWQFALSILLGLLIVLAALWLYARTVRNLRGSTTGLFLRMLLLLGFGALWLLLLHPITLGREKEMLLAGYWNSKLPQHLRYFFDYNRLLAWQEHFYDLTQYVLAGLLLPIAIETSAFGVNWTAIKRAGRVYLHWWYWLIVIVAGVAGTALTRALAGWIPGKGVAVEIASLLARLGVAYTVDILLWCFVLALTSIYLEEAEA